MPPFPELSLSQLKPAFSLLPEALLVTRLEDGTILYANEPYLELVEFTEAELIGHPSLKLYQHPEDRTLLLNQLQQGTPTLRLPIRTRAGQQRLLQIKIRQAWVDGAACLISSNRDVSAEETLQRETERTLKLQQLANEKAGISYWWMRLASGALHWDELSHALFEVPPGAPLDLETFLSRIDASDRDSVRQTLENALKLQKYSQEFRLNLPSGTLRIIQGYMQVIEDAEGPILLGLNIDVTERSEVQRHSELQLKLMDLSSRMGKLGFWWKDLGDHHEEVWSEYLNELWEQQPGERRDVNLLIRRLPEGPLKETQIQALKQPSHSHHAIGDNGFLYIMPSGTRKWIPSHYRKATVHGRELLFGINQDITEQKELQLERERRLQHMTLASQGAGIGFWAQADASGSIWWDDFCQDLLQLPPGEPLTLEALIERFPAQSREAQSKRLLEAHQQTMGGLPQTQTFHLLLPDQRERWIRFYTSLLPQSDQGPTLIGILQDITREVLQEEAMARTERLVSVGQLASEITHDLRQPIAALEIRLEQLKQLLDPSQQKQGEKVIQASYQALEHAQQITQRTLDLARTSLEARPQRLTGLLKKTLELTQTTLLKSRLTTEVHHPWEADPDHEPEVIVRPNEIIQVLQNLILNARDAILEHRHQHPELPPGPHLSFLFQQTRQGLALEVRDCGGGIPPEHLSRIFDALYSTKEQEGTGLGLALAKRIMETSGGSITASNRQDGTPGACFRLEFPLPSS